MSDNATSDNWTSALPAKIRDKWSELDALAKLLRLWNAKVNLVSRKDIDQLEGHQLLPCLAITKLIDIPDKARVLDLGCGGGLPGLPLAICYPNVSFHLLDSVGKKIVAVDAIANELELKNVHCRHARAESIKDKFDIVLGRAVAGLPRFLEWSTPLLSPACIEGAGVYYWKGGPLEDQIDKLQPSIHPLPDLLYDDPSFEDKYIVYISTKHLLGKR